jgi:hypothetical protein
VGRDSVTRADNDPAQQRTTKVAGDSELHFCHTLLVDELRLDGATLADAT